MKKQEQKISFSSEKINRAPVLPLKTRLLVSFALIAGAFGLEYLINNTGAANEENAAPIASPAPTETPTATATSTPRPEPSPTIKPTVVEPSKTLELAKTPAKPRVAATSFPTGTRGGKDRLQGISTEPPTKTKVSEPTKTPDGLSWVERLKPKAGKWIEKDIPDGARIISEVGTPGFKVAFGLMFESSNPIDLSKFSVQYFSQNTLNGLRSQLFENVKKLKGDKGSGEPRTYTLKFPDGREEKITFDRAGIWGHGKKEAEEEASGAVVLENHAGRTIKVTFIFLNADSGCPEGAQIFVVRDDFGPGQDWFSCNQNLGVPFKGFSNLIDKLSIQTQKLVRADGKEFGWRLEELALAEKKKARRLSTSSWVRENRVDKWA